MPPMQRPFFMMGEPPGVGSAWPWRITGTVRQKAEPLLAASPSSVVVVDFRKAAAAAAASFRTEGVGEQRVALLVDQTHDEMRRFDGDRPEVVDAALGEQ